MPIAYPFGLSTVISTSKSRSQPAAFRASEPRRGFSYFQASGTDTPVFWDVIFRFSKCDAANFIMWFTQDLDRGVLDFDMPIRTEFGLLTHTCRFMPDALLDAREMAEVFEYRAQIITRAQVIPADAITAWGGVFAGPIPDQFLSTGVPFSLNISTYFSGGLGPFTYSLASGGLPSGLSLNESTGVLSGTPITPGDLGDVVFRRSGAYCMRQHSNQVTVASQSPDPLFAQVAALLHFDGNATDVKGNTWTVGGSASFPSTPAPKFGSGFLSPNGSDGIYVDSALYSGMNSGSWCIEFWLYCDRLYSSSSRMLQALDFVFGTRGMRIYVYESGGTNWVELQTAVGSNFVRSCNASTSGSMPLNQWNHHYFQYHQPSGEVTAGMNGIRNDVLSAALDNTALTAGLTCSIGATGATRLETGGGIEEYRLTKAATRYSGATYTTPVAPFPNS